MTKAQDGIEWHWVKLDEELETAPEYATKWDGWLAWTQDEHPIALIVYESVCGKRAALQYGSLDLEIDAQSWEDGKRTAEVMLKHARALNAELSRA